MFTVMGHAQCAYCKQAIQLLASKGCSFTYIDIRDPDNAQHRKALKDAGLNSVPQVWVSNDFIEDLIGGFAELSGYLAEHN